MAASSWPPSVFLSVVEFLAPAKINLTLTVKGRRADGFHELESLVCPISLFDTLDIELRDEGGLTFTCDDSTLPTDDSNLVVRAVQLFCGACGIEPHLSVALTKRIPHGAGLGGGSSDAATTLIALNRLFRTELTVEALSAMAAELGSDVPLFLQQSAAVIRGRGELVEAAVFPHTLHLLLIKPSFGVPTPWAFSRWKDAQPIPGVRYDAQDFPWGTLHNDLERPVFEKYLLLAELKTWLLEQPEVSGALMSGSGATVFAVLKSQESANDLGERFLGEFGTEFWCCLAETVG